jgi:hypothetical protein
MQQTREFVRFVRAAWRSAAIGCVGLGYLGLGCLGLSGLALGCSDPQLGAQIRCQLDAIKVLPDDPLNATVYDAVDVIARLRACKQVSSEITVDGGKT